MSTPFVPNPGTLFYAECTVTYVQEIGSGSTATAVRQSDRSYRGNLFRCVATDDRAVIGRVVWGSTYGNEPRMLVRKDYAFHPVGPDVAAALGLDVSADCDTGAPT